MKLLLVILLVCLVVASVDGDGWWGRVRVDRVIRGVSGKRDIEAILESADVNNDGNIDQSEAEKILTARDAESFMALENEED